MDNFPLQDVQMNPSEGQLTQDITTLQGYSGIYKVPTVSSPFFGGGGAGTAPSNIDQFFSKVGSVFKESNHMFASAAKWVGTQFYNVGKDILDIPNAIANAPKDNYLSGTLSLQADGMSARLDNLMKQYHTGQINSQQYTDELNQFNKDNTALSHKVSGLQAKIKSDSNQFIQDTIALETAIITIATAGLTAPVSGAEGASGLVNFLAGKGADEAMTPAEEAIGKLATSKSVFTDLPKGVQSGVQDAVTTAFSGASKTMTSAQIARATTINLAIKYPLAFNYLTGTGEQVVKEIQSGKYGDAVKTIGFNAALLLSGGPIGQALKYSGKGLSSFSGKMFGSSSFLDELSKAIGDGNPAGIYNQIKDNPEAIRAFQALESTNMAATDGKTIDAAYRVINGYKANGDDITKMTHEYVVKDAMNWYNDQKAVTDYFTGKVGASEARKYVIGRWTIPMKNDVANAVLAGDLPRTNEEGIIAGSMDRTTSQRQQAFDNWIAAHPDSAAANNDNLYRQVSNIIAKNEDPGALFKALTSIPAQIGKSAEVPADLAKSLASHGHVVIVPKNLKAPFVEGSQKIASKFAEEGNDFFQKAVQPAPVLGEVGGLLTAVGLSPVRAQESVNTIFNESLLNNLEKTSVKMDPGLLRSKLTKYMNSVNDARFALNHPPLTDMRQLTVKEISKAAGITESQAKEVASAMMDSMIEVPTAVKGLSTKLTDYVMKANAGGKLSLGGYLRAQGAGRFAWNPFFKLKLAYKTEALSQLETGGKFPSVLGMNKILRFIMPEHYAQLDSTVKTLEDTGMFGSGFSNEAANDIAAGYGSFNARMLESQKLSIAGVVSSMAGKVNMTAEQYIQNFPNEVRDASEAILHYNPKASFLNSPLARTLNFAFFPFRFNIKVAGFMARALGKTDVLTQTAVIHGLMNAHNFLTSTEGQIWYSQNSDVIGLLEYFTPVAELKTIAALGNIHNESVGAFGELGGLPAGFISQILASEGLWNPSTPYLDPKTGQPSPNYIPATDKAKLATAISSFIGSLFSYPGATAGLPSKTKLLNSIAYGVTGAKSADWNKVAPQNLTPQQQAYQQAIESLNPQPQTNAPVQGNQGSVFPPTETGTAAPKYTASELRSKTKVKKANEPVTALPGQSVPGQIP